MTRVRISTTVDANRLAEARRRLGAADSEIIDRALTALIEQLEAERELAALTEFPYEDDPDLMWEAPRGPDLPYDGEVPADVLRLAAQRRRVGSR
ncbi:MAG: hypothetical protein ACRD0K_07155 [Egibacteraceae bacterium]